MPGQSDDLSDHLPLVEGPPAEVAPPLPWEEPRGLGYFEALTRTIKLFVLSPVRAFGRTPRGGSLWRPLLFAVQIGLAMTFIARLWVLRQNATVPGSPDDAQWELAWTHFMSTIHWALAAVLLGLFLWSGIVHFCSLMLGSGLSSDAGIQGTLRVVSYSYVSFLALLVPEVGSLIASIWFLVLQVIGLKHMHRMSLGRAAGAVLLPVVVFCGAVFAFIWLMLSAFRS